MSPTIGIHSSDCPMRNPGRVAALLRCLAPTALATLLSGCAATGLQPYAGAGPLSGHKVAPRLTLTEASTLPRPTSPLHQRHPGVAHGASHYLLTWQEGFNGVGGASDILALRIGPDGRPLDRKPLPIYTAKGIQETPAAAFGGGRFLVAWADRRNGVDYDVYAAFVSPSGAVTPRDGFLLAGGPSAQCHPAVAANGNGQFVVVWQAFQNGHFIILATRLDSASGKALDPVPVTVMDRGERPAVTWNGANYLIGQKWYRAILGSDGRILSPTAQAWNSKTVGWCSAASAWGKGFLFFDTEPFPDPWGWGGNGTVTGVSIAPDGASPEREAARAFKDLQAASADGRVANCLDATRWRNHPGWPMGMRGGLKGTHDNLWVSGRVAAAFNGRSLLCVWTRAHMTDNRRLIDRDLYLSRVLPDWGIVDTPPVKLLATSTEEANPILCGGPEGQALLAYEKVESAGVTVEYRLLTEQPDHEPVRVAYVVPKSGTEMIVAFNKPIDPGTAAIPGAFHIEGLAVTSAVFNADNRGRQREVILALSQPPISGRTYFLRVAGVKDRNTPANVSTSAPFEFTARPGLYQRGDFIERWAVLGPFPRNAGKHPVAPETLQAVPGTKVAGTEWVESKGSVQDLGARFGEKPDQMAYAMAYSYSDRPRQVMLRLDSNDHNRAWLNGRLIRDGITNAKQSRGFHDYADEIPVTLQPGWNRWLVQVENWAGAWLLVGQVVDMNGLPVRDLSWQISAPDTKPQK